jgi:hypothetical protein
MGRYYDGDINGKFMFAVQSSDAASRFGGEIHEPAYIHYYFDTEHLPEVEAEIEAIEKKVDVNLIDQFFESKAGYTSGQLTEAGITDEMLSDYADWKLGKQIRDCIKERGECSFDAEL